LERFLHFLRELVDAHVTTYKTTTRPQFDMLPALPIASRQDSSRDFHFGKRACERGIEGVLPLIIAFALIVIVGWLAVAYLQSTD